MSKKQIRQINLNEDYTNEVYYDSVKMENLFNVVLSWLDDNLTQPTFYTAGILLETIEVTKTLCKEFNIDLC